MKAVGVTFPGLELTRNEMTIVGSHTSANCFPEPIALLAAKLLRLPRAIQQLGLERAPEVFRRLGENPASLRKGVFVNQVLAA